MDSFVARDKSSLNSIFDKPSTLSVFSKGVSVQMSMVSLSGILVKGESTCRLHIKFSATCSTISSAKASESITVYSLQVKDFKIGTRNYASLQVGVVIADKKSRKGRQSSMVSLCTLQSPYIIPGLVPNELRDLFVYSNILLNATNFLKILSTRFSWWTAKLEIPLFFRLIFSSFHASYRFSILSK